MPEIRVNNCLLLINYAFKILPAWVVFLSWQYKASLQHQSCVDRCVSTPFYTLFTIFTPRYFLPFLFSKGNNCWVVFTHIFPPGIQLSDPTASNVHNNKKMTEKLPCPPLRLGFQKWLDVFNAVLCCHGDDVVQGIHVAQLLHNLFDLVPVGRYGFY